MGQTKGVALIIRLKPQLSMLQRTRVRVPSDVCTRKCCLNGGWDTTSLQFEKYGHGAGMVGDPLAITTRFI